MAFTPKEGQGSLFHDKEKKTEKSPDYTGSIMIGGEQKRIAAWIKDGKNIGKFLSLQISDFRKKEENLPF